MVPEVACHKYEPRVLALRSVLFLYDVTPNAIIHPLIRQQKERLDTV